MNVARTKIIRGIVCTSESALLANMDAIRRRLAIELGQHDIVNWVHGYPVQGREDNMTALHGRIRDGTLTSEDLKYIHDLEVVYGPRWEDDN